MTDNIDQVANRQLFLEWQEKIKATEPCEDLEDIPAPPRRPIIQEQSSPRNSQRIDTSQIDAEKAFLAFLGKNADLAMEDYRPGFWSTDKELSMSSKTIGETISERLHRLRNEVPQVLKATFNLISQTEFLNLKFGRESDLVVKGNFTIFKGVKDAEVYTKKLISVNPSLQKRFYGSNPAHAMLFDRFKPEKAVAINSIPSQKNYSKRPHKIQPLSIDSRNLRMAQWSLACTEIEKSEARIDGMMWFCGSNTEGQNMTSAVKSLVDRSQEILETSAMAKVQVQCQLASLSLGYVHPKDSNEESHADDDGEKEIQSMYQKMNRSRKVMENLAETEKNSADMIERLSFISRIEKYEMSVKALKIRLAGISNSIETLLKRNRKST